MTSRVSRTVSSGPAATVPATRGLKMIAIVWGVGLVIVFALLFAQTAAGLYRGNAPRAWAWFFPTVTPTFCLAVASLAAEVKQRRERQVSRFLLRLSMVTSAIYLSIVVATLLVRPITGVAPTEWLALAGIWLGPLQAAVSSILGFARVKE